jgi:hypothetical protein
MFSALSNGLKLRTYIIFKTKGNQRGIDNPYPNRDIIRHNAKGWVSDNLMLD